LITASNEKLIDDFKLKIMQAFEMTDVSPINFFLGMEIKQGGDEVFIRKKTICKRDSKKIQLGRLQEGQHSHESKSKIKQG